MRLLSGLLTLFLAGCAGPASPFGAVHGFSKAKRNLASTSKQPQVTSWRDRLQNILKASSPEIKIEPIRQILHQAHDIRIQIYDPLGIPPHSEFKVLYGGYSVSDQLIPRVQKQWSPDRHTLILTYRDVRIPLHHFQNIEFLYRRNKKENPFIEKLQPPVCAVREKWHVRTTGSFQTSNEMMVKLNRWAMKEKWNPALVAGIVAEESAFNPIAVSHAKALGLTQITPIADLELQKHFPNWQRSDLIDRYPAGVIKAWAKEGKITSETDWRFDPDRSLQGGLKLLETMEDFWQMKSSRELLSEVLKENAEQEKWNILLASYHSGPDRVRTALRELGANYLQSNQLNGARRYVKRVQSYCFHFAQGEKS